MFLKQSMQEKPLIEVSFRLQQCLVRLQGVPFVNRLGKPNNDGFTQSTDRLQGKFVQKQVKQNFLLQGGAKVTDRKPKLLNPALNDVRQVDFRGKERCGNTIFFNIFTNFFDNFGNVAGILAAETDVSRRQGCT